MRTDHRAEAAAIHLWRQASGEPIGYGAVKAHIAQCAQCADANTRQVWFVVNAWQRAIVATRKRALK